MQRQESGSGDGEGELGGWADAREVLKRSESGCGLEWDRQYNLGSDAQGSNRWKACPRRAT
jgi:hypothetical protein